MLALNLGYKIVYTGYFPSVMLIGVIPEQEVIRLPVWSVRFCNAFSWLNISHALNYVCSSPARHVQQRNNNKLFEKQNKTEQKLENENLL